MNKTSKAIFFDRDGIINKERSDYVKNVNELEIFPYAIHAIKSLKDNGFLIIVVTNQSAINRGLMNKHDLQKIHNEIQNVLHKNGTSINAFYFCPHKPDENCLCRKPKTGLLENAIHDFKIDVSQSWLIGNNDSDIEAATKVGCKSIKISDESELISSISKILDG